MQIQLERIYLFETSVVDPFFFGEKDGVTATMVADNPRIIDTLNIVTVFFYFVDTAKGGLAYNMKFGGEDSGISDSYGKSLTEYELQLNMPTSNQRQVEELVGKEFSILCMRRDLSHFVIFGQFICESFEIDNEIQQRISFKTGKTSAKLFGVNSFNIENIVNPIVPVDPLAGFDYELDFQLD